MNFERWTTLNRLLDEALDLGPAERGRFIEGLGPQYDSLRPRLRRLFAGAGATASGAEATLPKLRDLPEADPEPVPEAIGSYRILRKLGEGGMGAVWLAHRTDGMINRLVALKLPRVSWTRLGLAERLSREREILASLDHQHIARLYDAGVTSEGQPYLAIEYVDGRPLDDYVKHHGLGIRPRLRLFLQIAHAVAHAHARLIVHRDLKPSNILVTESADGGDGDVKLLDFGIATLLENNRADDSPLTEAAGRPLTPDYASPEQITGEPLSIASDIYSLGVLLYELLAGVRPYTLPAPSRSGRRALERAILEIDPQPPSARVPDASPRRQLQGDLDVIVLKALKKSPAERYATANALCDDIERHLDGRAVLARADSTWYRCSKWIARNRIACAAAASVILAILIGAGVATWQARVAIAEQRRAEEVRDFVITIFRDTSPYNGAAGRALSAIDWLKQVKARVDHRLDDRPELRVELLNIIGSSLETLQDTAGAEQVLSQAVQEATTRLGVNHPLTLHARVRMTPVLRFRGRTKELRAELDSLLPVLRANRACCAEDLVVALKNQAHLEIDDGRYAASEAAARECADVAVQSLGRHDPETVASLMVLAYAQQFTRPPDDALRATERAYRLAFEVYAETPTHPRAIEARLLYGRALGLAGDLAPGLEHLSHAVSDAATVFGPTSRMVGFFSEPLARFQVEAGEIDAALANSQQAVAIVAGHSAPDSWRMAVALHSRGAALLAARRIDEAIPDLARATAIVQARFPITNEFRRTYQTDYALALALSDHPADAEPLVAPFLPASRAFYVMGILHRRSGDARAALEDQQRALNALPAGKSADIDRMRALAEIGLDMQALGQPDQAVASLREALAISERAQTRDSPARQEIITALALRSQSRRAPAR